MTALAKRDEAVEAIGAAVQRAAGRATPKEVAATTFMSDEGVRKIREGDRKRMTLPTLISFMNANPEVAQIIEHYARRAQQASFWDIPTERDFNRDIHRAGR